MLKKLVLVGVLCICAPLAQAEGIWCVMMDIVGNTQPRSIYSGAFQGDPAEKQTYELAFWSYVAARTEMGYHPQVTCFWEASVPEARAARDDDAARARTTFQRQVQFTHWAY